MEIENLFNTDVAKPSTPKGASNTFKDSFGDYYFGQEVRDYDDKVCQFLSEPWEKAIDLTKGTEKEVILVDDKDICFEPTQAQTLTEAMILPKLTENPEVHPSTTLEAVRNSKESLEKESVKDVTSLAHREDVLKKTILRSFKKFFINFLRKKNKVFVARVLKTTKISVLMTNLIEVLKEIVPKEEDVKPWAIFLLTFLNLRPGKRRVFDDEIEARAVDAYMWLQSYSHNKFMKLWKCPEFATLFQVVYVNKLSDIIMENSTMRSNAEKYEKWVSRIIEALNYQE